MISWRLTLCASVTLLKFFTKLGPGGLTLLMSVHPLILAKCSQNRQTKIAENNFFCALKVPRCLLLMCVHLKWYVNHIGYDWECF